MTYVPHNSKTHKSNRFNKLLSIGGPEAYGLFWLTSEKLCCTPDHTESIEKTTQWLCQTTNISEHDANAFLLLCFEIGVFMHNGDSFWSPYQHYHFQRAQERKGGANNAK